MRRFETLSELAACAGQDVAVSDWVELTQQRIDGFAEATGDRQWIHVDVQRAASGPFGAPIAHGLLTLSLIPQFGASALSVRQVRMGMNYGFDKVRFTSPVPVGSRLRAHLHLLQAGEVAPGTWQFGWRVSIEREGHAKPACVAHWLCRWQQ